MAQQQAANYERLFQSAVPLYCPTEDSEGNLYAVSTNGEVYQVTEGQMNVKYSDYILNLITFWTPINFNITSFHSKNWIKGD
jgi:hypothetical protein